MKRILTALLAIITVLCAVPFTASAEASGFSLNRKSIALEPGESYTVKAEPDGNIKWTSADESVAKIDENGVVTGVSAGKTVITAEKDGVKVDCTVYVEEDRYGFEKNIVLTAFSPPGVNDATDEQYQYMKDAGISLVGFTPATREEMFGLLEMAEKYDLKATVSDYRFGANLLAETPEEITANVLDYQNVPAAVSFFMLDEPINFNIFLDAYKALKDGDPRAYMHINTQMLAAYSSPEAYKSQMNDWLKLCDSVGYHQDYVMYDMYPYTLGPGTMVRNDFLTSLDVVRRVGIENDVKTAAYAQSVYLGQNNMRSPNRAETLYEMNMFAAFGIKQISFYTWTTPPGHDNGIIGANLKPSSKYEFIKEINHKILNLGKTLIKCDTYETYESKNVYDSTLTLIPEDFFVQSATEGADFTVTYIKHKTTGRNYCMVVNNDFIKGQKFDIRFDDEIKSLEYISDADGEVYPYELKDGKAALDLEAGGAVLFVLPEGFDFSTRRVKTYKTTDNLALDGQVYCDSSLGESGWFIDKLNNGTRYSQPYNNGWRTNTGDGKGYVIVDLGKTFEFNRVDLYPAGMGADYGEYFPKDFTVSYSADRENWTKIAEAKNIKIKNGAVPSLKFKAVEGRYLKIDITGSNENVSELCEIEIYNDDGTVKAAGTARGDYEIVYKAESNVALGKDVYVSSVPEGQYHSFGWMPQFLVDGTTATGWTSMIKAHMENGDAVEYCIVDLKDSFDITKIIVSPKGDSWPEEFEISVSDGEEWVSLVKESGLKRKRYTIEPEKASGRYVRFKATKLTPAGYDGYMLQIGEIKIFGNPRKNAAEAEELITKYVAAGGSANSDTVKAVREILADENKTQSQLDVKLAAMLGEVDLKLPENTAEYDIQYEKSVMIPADTEAETDAVTDETQPSTESQTTSGEAAEKKSNTAIIVISSVVCAVIAAVVICVIAVKRKKR